MSGTAFSLQAPRQVSSAESRAVAFLAKEVPAWSRNNRCFSCHNNGDGARALYLAKKDKIHFPSDAISDTTAWLMQPDRWDKNKVELRFSDKRLADIQFASALQAALEAGQVTSNRPLQIAASKLVKGQSADGSWPVDTGAPAGSPATYGTSLATAMAVRYLSQMTPRNFEAAIKNGKEWLRKSKPTSVPAAAARVLAGADQTGKGGDYLLRAQLPAGAWGPYVDSPPEVFDTALALLALHEIAQRDRKPTMTLVLNRGRKYLIGQQEADGGWQATTRPSGSESYAQRISTTAWATLALLKSGGLGG